MTDHIKGSRMGAKPRRELPFFHTPDWFERAACGSLGTGDLDQLDQAFPNTVAQAREFIRTTCSWCPVRDECGEFADRMGVQHGVWGGKLYGKGYSDFGRDDAA